MKTIAALMLMTTAACAQSAVSELRTQVENVPQGMYFTMGGIDGKVMANSILELADRPVSRTCVDIQIVINTDVGVETVKSIKELLEDAIPRIQESCAKAGVP